MKHRFWLSERPASRNRTAAVEHERDLRFAAGRGSRAMSEGHPLEDAGSDFERMMLGDARYFLALSA